MSVINYHSSPFSKVSKSSLERKSVSPPRGAARPSHGVEIERVADGKISLAGETEDCQYRAVESPRNNTPLNGWMLMLRRVPP